MTNTNSSIDVLCLCNTHGIGGAQLNAGMLASEFSKRGLRSSLGFLFEREEDSRHGHDDYFVVGSRPPNGLAEMLRVIKDARREILTRRPRAIIGFQPASNIIASVAALSLPGCKVVATQRNPSSFQSASGRILDGIAGTLGLYESNIAVSSTVAQSYASYPALYRKRMRVVLNATPRLVATQSEARECKSALGIHPTAKILGCVGRLHPQKNFLEAIEVHAKLAENCHLYLAGSGPQEAMLLAAAEQRGTSSRVHFLGSLAQEDLTKFYRSLDLLLFTSKYEGFGRVLVEAMSMGVPVISNDIPIAREVAGDAAIFCEEGSNDWQTAVDSVLSDEGLRDSLCDRGLARAQQFTIERMVTQYMQAAHFT